MSVVAATASDIRTLAGDHADDNSAPGRPVPTAPTEIPIAMTDLAIVNEARKRYLNLLPVRELTDDGGLGAVIAALKT